MRVFCLQSSPGEEKLVQGPISVNFFVLYPRNLVGFCFSKSPGLSRGLTSRKVSGKCIIPQLGLFPPGGEVVSSRREYLLGLYDD